MGPSLEDFSGTSRFEVRRRLGAGAMGVVYEVHDREHNAVVALKLLSRVDPNSLFRFKHEFRALADIVHPNLISLYELFADGDQWFYTMELVEDLGFLSYVRPSLASAADTGYEPTMTVSTEVLPDEPGSDHAPSPAAPSQLDAQRLQAVLPPLVEGVRALHAAGQLHRDIKPSNILVNASGRVALADFGLVTNLAGEGTDRGIFGTPAYMSPEQATGEDLSAASDWYSFGTVLYRLLCGQAPYTGTSAQILESKRQRRAPPALELAPDAPRVLADLCMGLLEPRPENRPAAHEIASVVARLGQTGDALATLRSDIPVPAAAPTTPVFVGREEELAELHEALASTRRGTCAIAYVSANSGMGKTTLVQQFLAEARSGDDHALTLSCRCYERESLPYKALDGLIDSMTSLLLHMPEQDLAALLPEEIGALALLFPVLRRLEPIARSADRAREIVNPLHRRKRAVVALRELVRRVVRMRRMILYIDDLQWGDSDSSELLREVLAPPDPPALLLVVSYRREDRERSALLREWIERDPVPGIEVRQIELKPLTTDAIDDLVHWLVPGGAASETITNAICKESGGSPFFVRELVHHMQRGESITLSGVSTAVALDGMLRTRLSGLPEPARQLLETVACAGHPMAHSIIASAAGLGDAHDRALAVLRSDRLVRSTGAAGTEIVTYHDRVREVSVAAMSEADRRACHRKLAVAVEAADPDNAEALAEYWQGAGELPRAGSYALVAAERAVATLAFERAAELYKAALAMCAFKPEEKRETQIRMAEALLNARHGTEAAKMFVTAAEGADRATRLRCWPRAAEQLLISGHIEQGLALLRELLLEIGEKMPASPRRALLSLVWSRLKIKLRGTDWKPRERSEISALDLVRLDAYWAVGIGLVMADNISGTLFQARGLLLALATGERRRIARSLALEVILQATGGTGSLDQARELLARLRAIVPESDDDPNLLAWTDGANGFVEYFSGNYRLGAELLQKAERRYAEETSGTTAELNNVRLFKLQAYRYMGRYAELARAFADYDDDALRRGDHYSHTTLTRSFNSVWLARDDVAGARAALDALTWTPPERSGYHMQHWFELRAVGELNLYAGEAQAHWSERSADLALLQKSMLMRVQTIRTEGLWLLGRLALGARADLRLAERAANKLGREGIGYATVWSELLRAGIAQRAGQPHEAAEWLERAVASAEANEMALCAAVARRRLGDLRGGIEGAEQSATATAWMKGQGIAAPDRFCDVVVPGFGG
jgi:eukaryotic-like serine/threonine-protein kinase